MKAICLRTCYVRDRYCEAGNIFDLPGDFPLDHFKRLDEPEVAEVKAEPIEPITATTEAEKPMTPKEAVNAFVCPTCQKEFKSKIGLIGHSRTHK